jgi:hypothetical protein
VAATACHCFTDRTLDPLRPATADPRILATARSAVLSAAFSVPKAGPVRDVMSAAIPPLPGAAPEAKAARTSVAPAEMEAAEMEAALAAAAVVPPEAFRDLAARRADAARERLLGGGDLDPARVFVTAGGERVRKEGGARVYFELK